MKTLIIIFLLILPFAMGASAQINNKEQRYSATELKDDLTFLQQQLYTVHVYPYSELNKVQYDNVFNQIVSKLSDSLTATGFLKMIKPVIAYLSDEHAQAYLPDKLLLESYRNEAVFLPITLSFKKGIYRVDKMLNDQIRIDPGEIITKIDNIDIADAVKRCALFVSGYPDQRAEKALRQFGYLYTWTLAGIQHNYTLYTNTGKKITIPGVTLKVWQDELNKQTGWETACDEKISYHKFNDAGYISACSFSIPQLQLDSIRQKIDMIFDRIQQDNLKYLFIDLSKNSGGQSKVGKMLLDGFNAKPYLSFSQDFRKSEAYVKLLRSWKIEADDFYKAAPEGKVFHFNSDTIYPPQNSTNRFKGKVFIIVGNSTFSSAMMMAAWVKDNQLATIVGETPTLGHPNGFGELYNTSLPNTKIAILFGVKRWIRPSGDLNNNALIPDIKVEVTDNKEQLIDTVIKNYH